MGDRYLIRDAQTPNAIRWKLLERFHASRQRIQSNVANGQSRVSKTLANHRVKPDYQISPGKRCWLKLQLLNARRNRYSFFDKQMKSTKSSSCQIISSSENMSYPKFTYN